VIAPMMREPIQTANSATASAVATTPASHRHRRVAQRRLDLLARHAGAEHPPRQARAAERGVEVLAFEAANLRRAFVARADAFEEVGPREAPDPALGVEGAGDDEALPVVQGQRRTRRDRIAAQELEPAVLGDADVERAAARLVAQDGHRDVGDEEAAAESFRSEKTGRRPSSAVAAGGGIGGEPERVRAARGLPSVSRRPTVAHSGFDWSSRSKRSTKPGASAGSSSSPEPLRPRSSRVVASSRVSSARRSALTRSR
jgi:hypothetical protein